MLILRVLLAVLFLVVACGEVWAAAAHRSFTATTWASRTNTTITAPAGIQDGDVLLIVFDIGAATSAPTPTPPSGFVAVSGTWPLDLTADGFNVDIYVWYKIASGEAGNYTVTHANATSQGYIAAYSGGASAQPVATQNGTTGTGVAMNTTTANTITPSADSSVIVFVSSDWGDTANALSPPTGTTPTFTERLDPGTTAGLLYVADGVLSPAGATGNKTITNNCNTSNANPKGVGGILVAIEAAGGGPAAETFGFRLRQPQ